MPDIWADHADARARAAAALHRAQQAPLSRRRILLAALLIEEALESLGRALGSGDVLTYRAEARRRQPALADLLDLTALEESGPWLRVETVEVPIADYASLDLPDFMVSLYNGHTVQRVRLVWADQRRTEALPLLAEALAALDLLADGSVPVRI